MTPHQKKINLTIGAYRDDCGNPVVLDVVRDAESIIYNSKMDHEYLVQDGLAEFTKAAQELMFGESSQLIKDRKIYSIQSVAGTGSLRLALDFARRVLPNATAYIPDTTWPNHPVLLNAAQYKIGRYRYIDSTGVGFDFQGMYEDLKNCPENSIVLFHSCTHNPSGVDPNNDEWRQILEVVQSRKLFTIFDNAYQGFVSGDPNKDAFAVRLFADAGVELIACCSFSKNFGLYGERLGCVHAVTSDAKHTEVVCTVLRAMARALYSTCPSYGARIVATVLGDPERKKEWLKQCGEMATRLNQVRRSLYDALVARKVKGPCEWKHIIQQRGMFSFSGIPPEAVVRLKEEHHIYMLMDGRISLAGLNTHNTDRFADALADILGKDV